MKMIYFQVERIQLNFFKFEKQKIDDILCVFILSNMGLKIDQKNKNYDENYVMDFQIKY